MEKPLEPRAALPQPQTGVQPQQEQQAVEEQQQQTEKQPQQLKTVPQQQQQPQKVSRQESGVQPQLTVSKQHTGQKTQAQPQVQEQKIHQHSLGQETMPQHTMPQHTMHQPVTHEPSLVQPGQDLEQLQQLHTDEQAMRMMMMMQFPTEQQHEQAEHPQQPQDQQQPSQLEQEQAANTTQDRDLEHIQTPAGSARYVDQADLGGSVVMGAAVANAFLLHNHHMHNPAFEARQIEADAITGAWGAASDKHLVNCEDGYNDEGKELCQDLDSPDTYDRNHGNQRDDSDHVRDKVNHEDMDSHAHADTHEHSVVYAKNRLQPRSPRVDPEQRVEPFWMTTDRVQRDPSQQQQEEEKGDAPSGDFADLSQERDDAYDLGHDHPRGLATTSEDRDRGHHVPFADTHDPGLHADPYTDPYSDTESSSTSSTSLDSLFGFNGQPGQLDPQHQHPQPRPQPQHQEELQDSLKEQNSQQWDQNEPRSQDQQQKQQPRNQLVRWWAKVPQGLPEWDPAEAPVTLQVETCRLPVAGAVVNEERRG